jgi:hypothetical protein
MIVQLFIDALWTFFANQASVRFKFLTFLDNYSHKLGLYSLIRPVIFGLSLLFITELNLRYLGDIEAVGAIFGSMFLITIASY